MFDNVCSCIRRAVWQQHPFKATPIAEDLEWAMHVLLAGYRLAFTPSASVIHSHERNPRYELDRTYLVHQRLRALFGVKTISNPLKLVGVVAVTMAAHVRCLAGRHRPGIREITRALALGLALPLGQYLGALSYDRSWQILRPQGL